MEYQKILIYLSRRYNRPKLHDLLILDINTTSDNMMDYYAEKLTEYFFKLGIRTSNGNKYVITTKEFRKIISSSTYHLGSYNNSSLKPHKVKFMVTASQVKYFTDI